MGAFRGSRSAIVIKPISICSVEGVSGMKVEKPDFIVAGGMRCATGWIRQCLRGHPDIYMPQREPHYFDRNYEKGINWYLELFSSYAGEKIVGEKTASYFHYSDTPSRMVDMNPDVKVIVCLRDPIERMFSHYSMLAQTDKTLRNQGFQAAIELGGDFVNWSRYAEQVENYKKHIPEKNLRFVIYEDKDTDPTLFIQDLYTFLGVNPLYKSPSAELRTKLGQFEHNHWFWGSLSKILLHPRAPIFFRQIYSEIRPSSSASRIDEEIYKSLSKYFDDLPLLEELLGRKLDWRTQKYVTA